MIALEFKDPRSRLTSGHHLRAGYTLPAYINRQVQDAALDRGLITLTTSIYPVLRMIPSLLVSEAEVDEMLAILGESIAAVASSIEEAGKA